jgi:hypothetical protein
MGQQDHARNAGAIGFIVGLVFTASNFIDQSIQVGIDFDRGKQLVYNMGSCLGSIPIIARLGSLGRFSLN